MKYLLLLTSTLFLLKSATAQTVFINELHYDNSGTDSGEQIEIAGPAGTNLTGWKVVLYNGSNGQAYNTTELNEVLGDNGSGFGFAVISYPTNGIQNGAPDGLALVKPGDTVVQFLSYEGSFTANDGPALGQTSTDIGVSESSGTPIGASLQLTDTGSVYTDFEWIASSSSTFGSINEGQSFGMTTPPIVNLTINEIDVDQTGTDNKEFIELYDGGVGNSSLDSFVVVLYNGAVDAAYNAIDLSGNQTDENGYFVIGSDSVPNVDFVAFTTNGIQNGADAIALYRGTAAEFLGTPITLVNLIDAIVYDTNDADDAELLTLLNPGEPQVNENENGNAIIESLQRIPNGEGGLKNTSSYQAQPPTPGTINVGGGSSGPVTLLINEVDADQTGTDNAEFIELFDGGAGNSNLDGFTIVLYNGNGDVSYNAIDLSGNTTDENGYFVVGSSNVTNVDLVSFTTNGIQNGADAVALYRAPATDFPNGTAIVLDSLKDAVVYGTDDADDSGLLALLNAAQPQLNENGNGNKDTESLQRIPNGEGGARNTTTYQALAPTPGVSNSGDIMPGDELITIAEARAKAVGEIVTVQGILTVSDQFGGPAYIQDSTGGIPVFDSSIHGNGLFSIGDELKITAQRTEFQLQIQLGNVDSVELISTGNVVIPKTVSLNQLGTFEGQLVIIDTAFFPAPGNLLFGNSNLIISDASGSGEFRLDGDVTSLVGKIQPESCSIVGVIGSFQGTPQLLPRFAADLPCAEDFELSEGTVSTDTTLDVVTWNVEWFGNTGNGPSPEETQKDSVKAAILSINADIYAFQEVSDEILMQQLADELPMFELLINTTNVSRPPNVPGESQKLAFLYKPAIISPLSAKGLLESIHPLYNGGDESFISDYPDPDRTRFYASGRLPFVLEASVALNGEDQSFVFVNLHARANNSSDAQNRYDMRKYDVEVLKDSLDEFYPDANVVLLGDYNDDVDETVADIASTISSYEAFVNDNEYTIVTESLSDAGLRSFVFSDNMIDHITITSELLDEYIVNSEVVRYELYNPDYPNTTSDHFPVSANFYFKKELPSINRVILINPRTKKEVMEMTDGAIINFYDYVKEQRTIRFTIKAETADENVESVAFDLDGPWQVHRVENYEPYLLFGDWRWWYFGLPLKTGEYHLSLQAFEQDNGRGLAGEETSLNFSVVKNRPNNARIDQQDAAQEIENTPISNYFEIYPNPSRGLVNIAFTDLKLEGELAIYNFQGKNVYRRVISEFENTLQIDLSSLDKGLYVVTFTNNDGLNKRKIAIE